MSEHAVRKNKLIKLKATKLENLKKLFKKETCTYEIEEPALFDIVHLYTKFFLKRYAEGKGEHWDKNDFNNVFNGMLGQKAFEIMLQQFNIAYIPNDPTIDWRGKMDFDFFIPKLGTIEVKTFHHRCYYTLVKKSEWHDNDFLVVFQTIKERPALKLMGWLYGSEVPKLKFAEKGQYKFSQEHSCYYTTFDKLRPASEFIKMLLQLSHIER